MTMAATQRALRITDSQRQPHQPKSDKLFEVFEMRVADRGSGVNG